MISLAIHKALRSSSGKLELRVETELKSGNIIALYGISGAGKTSLLRMIAGLMKPDSGSIKVNGNSWFDSSGNINIPPQKRNTGMVFQDYALFPNLTVEGNLRYALRDSGDNEIITSMLEKFELRALKNEKPATLSGGQQQRVALARALVQSPGLLLLDEPLSALDHKLRQNLQQYITDLNRTNGTTVILVSHDLGEIFRVAHEVLVIDEGQIVQHGTPGEVFSRKQISGKFRFTGEILSISKEDVIYVAQVLIGQDIIKVVIDPGEVEGLKVGDHVLVASKAFNPIIQRIP